MPNLRYAVLHQNPKLSGSIQAIQPALLSLILADTNVGGTLHDILSPARRDRASQPNPSASQLRQLILSASRVSGYIPEALPPVLEQLILDRAAISGSIPAAVASVGTLIGFQANDLALSGTIPQGAYESMEVTNAASSDCRSF